MKINSYFKKVKQMRKDEFNDIYSEIVRWTDKHEFNPNPEDDMKYELLKDIRDHYEINSGKHMCEDLRKDLKMLCRMVNEPCDCGVKHMIDDWKYGSKEQREEYVKKKTECGDTN